MKEDGHGLGSRILLKLNKFLKLNTISGMVVKEIFPCYVRTIWLRRVEKGSFKSEGWWRNYFHKCIWLIASWCCLDVVAFGWALDPLNLPTAKEGLCCCCCCCQGANEVWCWGRPSLRWAAIPTTAAVAVTPRMKSTLAGIVVVLVFLLRGWYEVWTKGINLNQEQFANFFA